MESTTISSPSELILLAGPDEKRRRKLRLNGK
jgi:hypothetical protein